MPTTCDSGSLLGCTVASFPLIIGGLAAVVLLLLALRLALIWRERRRAPSQAVEVVSPPRDVKPGSPLQPSSADAKPRTRRPPEQVPSKPSPLQLKIADAPDLTLADFNGDTDVQGDFGEVMTAVALASQGWKLLPSKLHARRGIGGLFVREVKGGGGYEGLATVTRTNTQAYEPAGMTDDRLAGDIADLYELGAFSKTTTDELLRGLQQGASFFRKELWRHDLSSGLTTVTELGRKGEKGRSVTRSNARLMTALHASLEGFDRNAAYLGRPPVDDET